MTNTRRVIDSLATDAKPRCSLLFLSENLSDFTQPAKVEQRESIDRALQSEQQAWRNGRIERLAERRLEPYVAVSSAGRSISQVEWCAAARHAIEAKRMPVWTTYKTLFLGQNVVLIIGLSAGLVPRDATDAQQRAPRLSFLHALEFQGEHWFWRYSQTTPIVRH